MLKTNDNKRPSVKTHKAGHLLSPFAAVYWQTRHMLLNHYTHRVVSDSHGILLVAVCIFCFAAFTIALPVSMFMPKPETFAWADAAFKCLGISASSGLWGAFLGWTGGHLK